MSSIIRSQPDIVELRALTYALQVILHMFNVEIVDVMLQVSFYKCATYTKCS